MMTLVSALFLAGAASVAAMDAAGWRSQSIYQVLIDRFARTDLSTTASCNVNYNCGGTWDGLIQKLDYIQDMGFTAIWISPVVENIYADGADGSAYHGYWAQDIYNVNSNFGSASDLVNLSNALHERGMYLMVDFVTNHMGYNGCRDCVDYSIYNPFDSSDYFHPPCAIQDGNTTSQEVCWEGDNTVSLPDLRTEDDDIRGVFNDWVVDLVKNYSVDGLRADSMLNVEPDFWPQFADNAGVYVVGEADTGNPQQLCNEQNYLPGVLNYAAYYWVLRAFEAAGNTMSELVSGIGQLQSYCSDVTLLGSFIENHDVPRFPSYNDDIMLAANTIAFTIMHDGIPIIYEGQEQHLNGGATPNQREAIWLTNYDTSVTLYGHVAKYNAIRNYAIYHDETWTTTLTALTTSSDNKILAMKKGADSISTVTVLSSYGTGSGTHSFTIDGSFHTYFANSAVVDVVSCTSYTVTSSGVLTINITGGAPVILYTAEGAYDSGICKQ